ncbi:uncharacterized protein [Venturia canescens]|uniref:uncharacterized protein n=1 Tax=Venturia canescens TaxID=32260 RepID=UPI001C9CF993|nr:uncharacterized protein LOC122408161 [Venturia canescens]
MLNERKMYKTHSTLIALAMLSASCFHNAMAVHAPADAQEHQHGGHPHRRAKENPVNSVPSSSSGDGSSAPSSLTEPLFVDLSGMLKDLAVKYNISNYPRNNSKTDSRRSLAGKKRAARPGCCG